MQDFHQLEVWKRAHALVLRVYEVSKTLPASENFGLILNLRRSAVAVARTIAEGAGRSSDLEFAGDLKKARAAAHELEYLLLLSRDLGFLAEDVYRELTDEDVAVRKMISGLNKRLTGTAETLR